MGVLKYLSEALAGENKSPGALFDSIDYLGNEVVSTSALADVIVNELETWFFSRHYMKLIKALDIDGDSTVNKQDFIQLVTLASKSTASTDHFYSSDVHRKQNKISPQKVIEHMNQIINMNNKIGNRLKVMKSIF